MNKHNIHYYKDLILHVVLMAVFFSNNSFPQTREYMLKAGYIEKFTHFIEWPEITAANNAADVFSIAVFGENKYENALENIFSKTKVKNRKVHIKYISSINEIDNCMILIISTSKKDKLKEILNSIAGKSILTIGETAGWGKMGVMINMLIYNNYIRYEINLNALNKSGLKVNSLLLTSAIIIKEDE
jgi:hypothetical protein